MRGGGVGFYIKDYLNASVIEELSPFENKIIEALTIKPSYPDNKHVPFSSNVLLCGEPHLCGQLPINRRQIRFILL